MERKHKRKTASAITRILMALIVISSWAVLGVALALKSANVQMSGSISFKATEIFADITGSVSGTATTNTLGDINIKSDTTQEQINAMATGWSNMTLDFTDANLITVTVNITNKATDRTMWATFTDGIDGTNLTVKRYVNETQKQTLDALEISANTTSTIKIEMSVADLNTSIDDTDFGLGIDLFATQPEVKAASEYSMLTFSYNDTQKTATLTGNNNATGNVVIPSQILKNDEDSQEDAYTVTAIANSSFKDNTEITALMIPETVSSITTSQQGTPISGCSNLTTLAVSSENETYHSVSNGVYTSADESLIMTARNVSISASTKKINYGAYQYDTSITSLVIPEGVTEIGDRAFAYCTNLTSVTLPSTLQTIGVAVFDSCTSLKQISVKSGNAVYYSYGNGVYKETELIIGCNNTIIKEGTTSIASGAFQTGALTSLVIPSSVIDIGTNNFKNCPSLASIVVAEGNAIYSSYGNGLYKGTELILGCKNTIIKDGTTSIGKQAFWGCTLTTINIPSSVKTIGEYAFQSAGLSTAVIPEGVETIETGAFQWCTSLTSVTISSTVNKIGSFAFDGCSALTSAIFVNTSGWKAGISGSSMDVSDPAVAATYLTSSWYSGWTRSDS